MIKKRSIQEKSWMLLFFIFTFGFVFAGELTEEIWVKRDLHRHFIPLWSYGVETLQSGRIPFWNPYILSGHPFLASLQTCVFYPPTLLFHLIGVIDGLNAYIVFHLVLAAYGMYRWMRAWGVGLAAATVSGLAYAMSGSMLSAINAPINLAATAYFPFCMLALRRVLAGGGAAPTAGLALVLSLMFLAGDPSVVHATLVVSAAFCLFRFVEMLFFKRHLYFGLLLRPFVSVFLFLGLVSFQLFPFMEYISKTERVGMTHDTAVIWSVPFEDMIGLAVPFFADVWRPLMDYGVRQSFFDNYYAGSIILVLSCIALFCAPRDRRVRFASLLFVLGWLLVAGKHTPFYAIYCQIVPAAKSIRYPVRFFFLVNFSIACLSGLGLNALIKARYQNCAMVPAWIAAAAAAACAGTAATLWALSRWGGAAVWLTDFAKSSIEGMTERAAFVDIGLATLHNATFAVLAAAAGLGIVFLISKRLIAARWAGAILVLLVFFDLRATNTGFEPHMSVEEFKRESPNISWLKAQEGHWRVAPSPSILYKYTVVYPPTLDEVITRGRDRIVTNMNVLFRIPHVVGYDSQYTSETAQFLRRYEMIRDPSKSSLLDAVSAKYVIIDTDQEAQISPQLKLVHRGEAADIYENLTAMPRAFVADSAVWMEDNGEILRKLSEEKTNLFEIIYLQAPPQGVPVHPTSAKLNKKKAEIVFYRDDRVEIEVEASEGGWLCLADTYDSNWHVFVNGQKETVYRANGLFRAVRVPSGKSLVRFEYHATAFFAGLLITVLSGLVLLALCIGRKVFKSG